MTKYYLHGGKASVNSKNNKIFFQQLVENLEGTVNFLCIYFAKDRRLNKNWDWNIMFNEDIKQISSFCPNINFNFVLAVEGVGDFSNQIKNADILFFKGGIVSSLLQQLKKVSSIEDLFQNKIVSGSSAGALVFAKYYYDGDYDTYNEGLGILPIKLICHWDEKRYSKLEDLKKIGEDLQIYTIPEESFFMFKK